MASKNGSYVGPQPRLHPIGMVVVFGIFLTLFAGPAYNSNGFRSFLRESGFLEGSPNPESLLIESGKIFQTMDVMLGAVVGLVFDFAGPRITHALGYVFFGTSLFLMMRWYTLWYGMLLQGCAAVFLLNSAIHIANLFERGSKFAVSIITSTVEVGFILYPGLSFACTIGAPPKILMATLIGLCVAGGVATLLLFPNEPFFPRNQQSRLKLVMNDDAEVVTGQKPDYRDDWGDPEKVIPSDARTVPIDESSSLLELRNDTKRASRMSVSMIGLMEGSPSSNIGRHRREGSFLSQLLSLEWILITLVFTFMVFRANLYLDGNEQILLNMGDGDGRLINMLAYMMPFSFVAALLNGVIMEFIGIIPATFLLNACGIGVNILSITEWLDIQKLTFILFIFSRASCWTILFSYTLETLGLRYFVLLTGISLMFCGIINMTCGTLIIRFVFASGVKQWYWINTLLMIGGVVTFIALAILEFLRRSYRQEKPKDEEDYSS